MGRARLYSIGTPKWDKWDQLTYFGGSMAFKQTDVAQTVSYMAYNVSKISSIDFMSGLE